MKKTFLYSALVLTSLLVGCNSGGGSSSSNTDNSANNNNQTSSSVNVSFVQGAASVPGLETPSNVSVVDE